MSAYNDIDEAVSYANSIANSAASKNGWDANQKAQIARDIQTAYDDNSNWLEINEPESSASSFFDSTLASFGNYLTLDFGAEYDSMNTKLVRGFWEDLHSLAKKNWASYKNSSEIISFFGSAGTAAQTEMDEITANNPSTIVSGGIGETVEDLGDAGKNVGDTVMDPKFWYGLAAVAALGSIGYFVRAFR